MRKFATLAISSASCVTGQETNEFRAVFDAVPRALKTSGDLLSGYGMKGSYALVNTNNAAGS